MTQPVLYAILFFLALVADFATTRIAILRGLREGNTVLKADPMLLMAIFSVILIGPAEACRQSDLVHYTVAIYQSGAAVHGAIALWNLFKIVKGK